MGVRKGALAVDLGLIGYEEARQLQLALVSARQTGRLQMDIFLFLEHLPVMTLGKRGGRENLIVSEAFLDQRKIPLILSERGGEITYHGPGQLVVYGILDLTQNRMDVPGFVFALEESMIRSLAAYGLTGERLPVNRGVFLSGAKIGSVGIGLKNSVTFHGMALNVTLDLAPFSWINPCGLRGVKITSIQNEISGRVHMIEVKAMVRKALEDLFALSFEDQGRSCIEKAFC